MPEIEHPAVRVLARHSNASYLPFDVRVMKQRRAGIARSQDNDPRGSGEGPLGQGFKRRVVVHIAIVLRCELAWQDLVWPDARMEWTSCLSRCGAIWRGTTSSAWTERRSAGVAQRGRPGRQWGWTGNEQRWAGSCEIWGPTGAWWNGSPENRPGRRGWKTSRRPARPSLNARRCTKRSNGLSGRSKHCAATAQTHREAVPSMMRRTSSSIAEWEVYRQRCG